MILCEESSEIDENRPRSDVFVPKRYPEVSPWCRNTHDDRVEFRCGSPGVHNISVAQQKPTETIISMFESLHFRINFGVKNLKNVKRKHLVDRLILNDKRIDQIRHSINEIAKFQNPIGRVIEKWQRPNKLKIKKVTTPIGLSLIHISEPTRPY